MAGAPMKQPGLIKALKFIAETHGYSAKERKKDPTVDPESKKFLPDLVATPFKGTAKRVFEVEVTISNNTIYKSLFSLLTALTNGTSQAYLVVPTKSLEFVEGCLANVTHVVRHFSKSAKGAYPKMKITLVGSEEVTQHYKKAKTYIENGKSGAPPKCHFFPRS